MTKYLFLFLMLPTLAWAGETANPDLETFMSIWGFLVGIPIVGPYIPIVTTFIGVMAAIAALPIIPKGNPDSDKWYSRLWYRIRLVLIDIPAMNIGAAKNEK